MKKLLGFIVIVALFVLSACGGSDETVCSISMFGEEMLFIIESEDGVVTSVTTEIRIDVSAFDDDMVADIIEVDGGTLEGNYIVTSETESNMDYDFDLYIAGMEIIGATCN